MSKTRSGLPLAAWIASLPLAALLVLFCVRFLDLPLALYVKEHLYANMHWSQLTSDLPDLLSWLVISVTVVSLLFYRARVRQGLDDALTRAARLLAWAAPVSYLVKLALKFVFGRVNTRVWLEQPGLNGFHWFQGGEGIEGFPSGHMLVVSALLAVHWRFFPKLRPLSVLTGLGLGVALIATDYHFLGDVVAGAYLGILVEAVLFRLQNRSLGPPTAAP